MQYVEEEIQKLNSHETSVEYCKICVLLKCCHIVWNIIQLNVRESVECGEHESLPVTSTISVLKISLHEKFDIHTRIYMCYYCLHGVV